MTSVYTSLFTASKLCYNIRLDALKVCSDSMESIQGFVIKSQTDLSSEIETR